MTHDETTTNVLASDIPPEGTVLLDFFDRCLSPRSIVREDGLVLYRNRPRLDIFAVVPLEIVGGSLLDLEPRDVWAERVHLMQTLAQDDRDGLVRAIWSGRQFITHLYILPLARGHDKRCFICVTEPAPGPQHGNDQVPVHEPACQDLGPLKKLSPRELEVLAMLGEGLRAAVIAQRLHRSVDTIKGHKAALLKKLNCENFVQLALIAHAAGLKAGDATRYISRRRGQAGDGPGDNGASPDDQRLDAPPS